MAKPQVPRQIIFCNFKDRRAHDTIIIFVGCFKRLFGHTGIEPSCGLRRHCNGPNQVHQLRLVPLFRHLLSQVRHRFLLRNAVHQFRSQNLVDCRVCKHFCFDLSHRSGYRHRPFRNSARRGLVAKLISDHPARLGYRHFALRCFL